MQLKILFFGSFQKFSVLVLEKLTHHFQVTGVVTTPPQPAGRHMLPVSTDVSIYSKKQNLPLFELESLDEKSRLLLPPHPDFIVVAGFGKLIPPSWLEYPKIMSVNLHQSLLPKYAGRFPAEWAILNGETETGNTLIKMSPEFDKGEILVQETIPISSDDTRVTLYSKLYDQGGDLLVKYLPQIAAGQISPHPQPSGNKFYAKQLTREDGFIPWDKFVPQLENRHQELTIKFRALQGWPGVWTTTPKQKRLKLISLHPRILIQEEGKTPKPWQSSEF